MHSCMHLFLRCFVRSEKKVITDIHLICLLNYMWKHYGRTETFGLTRQEHQSVKWHQGIAFLHSSLDSSYLEGRTLVWQTLMHDQVDVRSNSTAYTNLEITCSRIKKRAHLKIVIQPLFLDHRFLGGVHAVIVFWWNRELTLKCKLKC